MSLNVFIQFLVNKDNLIYKFLHSKMIVYSFNLINTYLVKLKINKMLQNPHKNGLSTFKI